MKKKLMFPVELIEQTNEWYESLEEPYRFLVAMSLIFLFIIFMHFPSIFTLILSVPCFIFFLYRIFSK